MSRPRTETITVIVTMEIPVVVTINDDPATYLQPADNSTEWEVDMSNKDLNNLINAKIEEQVNEYDFD
jgi:hypothetical protein